MSVMLKILPLAAAAGVAVGNADALKKSLNVIGKVQVAATSGVEMQGIAEGLAGDFVETKDLPVENFGTWLKENMREKGGKETRDKSKDPWGTEYQLTVDVPKNGFSVLSAGPDKAWKTEDDLKYFYSLTGIEGKDAISAALAARARVADSRRGTSTASASGARPSSAGKRSPGAAASKATGTPRQSDAETQGKVVDALLKRAAGGEAKAQYDLANRYILEDGVLKDFTEARRLLEQAVKNADSETLRGKAQTQLDNLNKVLEK